MSNKELNILSVLVLIFFGLNISGCGKNTNTPNNVEIYSEVYKKRNTEVTVFDSYISKINSKDLNIRVGDVFYKNVYFPYNMIDEDGNDAPSYVDYENLKYFEKSKHTVGVIKGEQLKYNKPSDENGTVYSIVTVTQVMPRRIKGYIKHESGLIEEVNDIIKNFIRSTDYYFINSKGMLEMAENGIDKEADSYRKKIGNYCIGNLIEARKWIENNQLIITNCNDSSVILEKVIILKYNSRKAHGELTVDKIDWNKIDCWGIFINENVILDFLKKYNVKHLKDNFYLCNKTVNYTSSDAPVHNDFFYIKEIYIPKCIVDFLKNDKKINDYIDYE